MQKKKKRKSKCLTSHCLKKDVVPSQFYNLLANLSRKITHSRLVSSSNKERYTEDLMISLGNRESMSIFLRQRQENMKKDTEEYMSEAMENKYQLYKVNSLVDIQK
ncbi:unnamed protein product [Lepeophtheirus salmonis]|uniref:(salmon louse) hypothetical protein n=1 Tax=Lepeophtheirus salmonis TaxID=72036 RepID=A0A7R8CE33_LEPSM|nr:unnamed protein product [Lepeophtheirus salmonis]CAF2792225.1 unnamed protein product [Lepeophtheirus salmonis]